MDVGDPSQTVPPWVTCYWVSTFQVELDPCQMQNSERTMCKSPNLRWLTHSLCNCRTVLSWHCQTVGSPAVWRTGRRSCIFFLENHWVQLHMPAVPTAPVSLASGMKRGHPDTLPCSQPWEKTRRGAGLELFGLCQARHSLQSCKWTDVLEMLRRFFAVQSGSHAVWCFYLFVILFCFSKSILLNNST